MRTLVDIPKQDLDALDRLGRRRRTSRAHVIREAVSAYLARNRSLAMDEAFGLWSEAAIDGLDYQRKIRSEW
jgi:metal-responsive CopG/Arc/MetJ family transcriptional regulator